MKPIATQTHAENPANKIMMHCEIFFAEDDAGNVQSPVASTLAVSTANQVNKVSAENSAIEKALPPLPQVKVQPQQKKIVETPTSSIAASVTAKTLVPAAIVAKSTIKPVTPITPISAKSIIPQMKVPVSADSADSKPDSNKDKLATKQNREKLKAARGGDTKPRVPYNPKARNTRMQTILQTIFRMAEKGTEITVQKIKNEMAESLLPQIKSGELKEENISADINAAMKVMGGMVELRREPSPRGRPYAVYGFDPSKLTERGEKIRALINLEGSKAD